MNRRELIQLIKQKRSFLCIGLDTDLEKIPQHLLEEDDPIFAFNKAIIDRGCTIEAGMVVGEDHEADRKRGFRITENGVVLVTPDMLNQPTHARR